MSTRTGKSIINMRRAFTGVVSASEFVKMYKNDPTNIKEASIIVPQRLGSGIRGKVKVTLRHPVFIFSDDLRDLNDE